MDHYTWVGSRIDSTGWEIFFVVVENNYKESKSV